MGTAFAAGAVSRVEVLAVTRQQLDAEDQAILGRAEAARAGVAAFRALGGGWQAEGPKLAMAGLARGRELGVWGSKDAAIKPQEQPQRAAAWNNRIWRN